MCASCRAPFPQSFSLEHLIPRIYFPLRGSSSHMLSPRTALHASWSAQPCTSLPLGTFIRILFSRLHPPLCPRPCARCPQDDKARKLERPIPRTIRESALFLRSGDGAWEFLRAVDSNWDRDRLEYTDSGKEPVAAA